MCCSCTGHILTVMSHLRERLVWNAWGLKERSTPALEEPGIVQWMFRFEQSERIEACLRRSGAVSSSSSRPSHTKEHLPCRSQTLTICAGKSGWGHGPFPKSFVDWLQVTNDSSPLLENLCPQRYVLRCKLNAVTFCDMLWLYYAVLVWPAFQLEHCLVSATSHQLKQLRLHSASKVPWIHYVTLRRSKAYVRQFRHWIYSLMTLLSNLSILDSMRLRLLQFKPNLLHCTIRGQTKTHWRDAGQVVLWAASKALSKLRMLMSSKQNQSSTCCSPALLHHTNACRRLQVPKQSLATS